MKTNESLSVSFNINIPIKIISEYFDGLTKVEKAKNKEVNLEQSYKIIPIECGDECMVFELGGKFDKITKDKTKKYEVNFDGSSLKLEEEKNCEGISMENIVNTIAKKAINKIKEPGIEETFDKIAKKTINKIAEGTINKIAEGTTNKYEGVFNKMEEGNFDGALMKMAEIKLEEDKEYRKCLTMNENKEEKIRELIEKKEKHEKNIRKSKKELENLEELKKELEEDEKVHKIVGNFLETILGKETFDKISEKYQ